MILKVFFNFLNFLHLFNKIYLHFQVLSRHFLRAMRQKRQQKLATFLLHHDNVLCHKSASPQARIDELGFTQLDHPAYSPELAPNDFYLFPTLKRQLRGIRMDSLDELRKRVLAVFRSIPKDDCKKLFITWVERWQKCVK